MGSANLGISKKSWGRRNLGPSCRSLDTSVLDALALGGDGHDSTLDFMIGEPFPGKGDAAEKPQQAVTDERPADGAVTFADTTHACSSSC